MSTIAISTPDTSRNMSTTSSRSSSASLSPTSALTSVVSTPRSGTEFKDRIFVGGFPPTTTDFELRSFFTKYGTVKEAKIIRDHAGASKGYGFITFENEEQAKKVRDSCGGFLNDDNSDVLLDFKGRKLNIGPAIRKASNNRNQNLEVIPQGAVMVAANGTPYLIQNGLAYCAAPDAYAITHPNIGAGYHPMILPQQYIVGQPQFVFPSNMGPTAVAPMQQQQIQPQHVVLSPISQSQQGMVSQQQLQPAIKSLESPNKMAMSMQGQQQNVSNTHNSSHNDSMGHLPNIQALSLNGFNIPPPNSQYQWTSSTMSGPLTQYVYPPCCQPMPYGHEVHSHYQSHLNANDAQNPTGVVTPPPTPITIATKRRRNGGSNSNYT